MQTLADALKFVKLPSAKGGHYRIQSQRITADDGLLAVSSPVPITFDCMPEIRGFDAAMSVCKGDTPAMSLTDAGKLRIGTGRIRSLINCLPQTPLNSIDPSGHRVGIVEPLLPTLAAILPFVSDNPVHTWAKAALFKGASVTATNNIVIAERWSGLAVPTAALVPREMLARMLKLGEEPESLTVSASVFAAWYPGGRWIAARVLDAAQFPAALDTLLCKLAVTAAPTPLGLSDALALIAGSVDADTGRVYLSPGRISTAPNEGEHGMTVELPPIQHHAAFVLRYLASVAAVATHIDLAAYPQPSAFFGDKLRGAIVGVRL